MFIYKKIQCPIDDTFKYKYINGFLKLKSNDNQYDFIRKFNETRYWNGIQFLNKLIEFNEIKDDEENKR